MQTVSGVGLLLTASALAGCLGSSSDEARDTAPAAENALSFVNRVWRVEESTGMSPGQLVVFLSDGTLVFASPFDTPELGTWRLDGGSLTMVEEGIPYDVEIRSLSDDAFEIRSHNPGGFVDTRFVPATNLAPDEMPAREVSRTSAASTTFHVSPSQSGRLALEEDELRFRACGEAGAGTVVEDVESGDGSRLLRELGAGPEGIAVLVRLRGSGLQEIRYAGVEGPDCSRLPPGSQVEARGNEPFWFVRVEGDTAQLVTPEIPDGLDFGGGGWRRPGENRWRYEAERVQDGNGELLILELNETPCADSMSGARYPFRATVYRNGERLEGCALEGRGAYTVAADN